MFPWRAVGVEDKDEVVLRQEPAQSLRLDGVESRVRREPAARGSREVAQERGGKRLRVRLRLIRDRAAGGGPGSSTGGSGRLGRRSRGGFASGGAGKSQANNSLIESRPPAPAPAGRPGRPELRIGALTGGPSDEGTAVDDEAEAVLETRAAGTPFSRAFTADLLKVRNAGVLQARAAGAPSPRAFTAYQLVIRNDGVLQTRAAGTKCLTAFVTDKLEIRNGVLQTRAAGPQCLTTFIADQLEIRRSMPDGLHR